MSTMNGATGNTSTRAEAEALVAPIAAAFSDGAAREEMIKLLMADRSAGEGVLAGLKPASSNTCDGEEARKLMMAKYGCFRGDYAREEVVQLLMRDKDAGMRLLAGLKELPKPDKFTTPPPPQHDPDAGPVSDEARAAATAELIKQVRSEGRFTDYTSAREEARRRNPSLFS